MVKFHDYFIGQTTDSRCDTYSASRNNLSVSDKARAIGGAVLEAMMHLAQRR
jgi:hypothetical protein